MKNQAFQQEILENVTEGVKPSDLKKKLKRSKSVDDIANNNPPVPLLQDQLTNKQKEVESLRKKNEQLSQKLTETTEQLDNSLFARVEAVKQFGLIYDKLQLVKQELDDTVDQASDELVKGDDKNSQLRTKLFTARQQISDLQRDLKLARINQNSLPSNPTDPTIKLDYLQYGIYALGTIILIS